MRRVAIAAVAALLPLAVIGQAQAADKEYVQLNEKGMKQILLKKSWAPGWLGGLNSYDASVSVKGAKPQECATKGTVVTGQKSSSYSVMAMDFNQGDGGNYLDVIENVYQYKDVETAQLAWQGLQNAVGACAGTFSHDIKDKSGTKIGTTTVNITVTTRPGMYGQQQVVINEDVQYVEPTPGAQPSMESADEISIWMYDGAALIELESNKFVPKTKGWVYSEPQVATMETLALVAIQRYHLYALKAL